MPIELGPNYSLAIRLANLERSVASLAKRDVLQNASISSGGLTIMNGGSLLVDGDATFNGTVTLPTGSLDTPGGSITAGQDLIAGDDVIAGDDITAGGTLQGSALVITNGAAITDDVVLGASGSLFSIYGRNTPVVTSYVSAYFNSDGRLGATPSSLRYKQDVSAADLTDAVDALLHVALTRFRYIAAVEEFGTAAAPYEVGPIAEYWAATPALREWVYDDENGDPQGVSIERLTIPLIAVVQSLDARLRAAGL